MAFTGVCTKEMCEVSQGMNAYSSLNAEVWASAATIRSRRKRGRKRKRSPWPLLSDYEHKVTRAYGIAYDSFLPQNNLGMGGVAKRSAFVVDKQGVIRYAEINDDPRQATELRGQLKRPSRGPPLPRLHHSLVPISFGTCEPGAAKV